MVTEIEEILGHVY